MGFDDRIARRLFVTNIVLAGGNTTFVGFKDRLQKELEELVFSDWKVRIVEPPQRKHGAWIGGAILTSLATFDEAWITRKEYEEKGASIINERGHW